jgi:membrane protein
MSADHGEVQQPLTILVVSQARSSEVVMFGRIRHLLTEGLETFIDDEILTRGAAIAFYAVTAVVPLLFIALRIADLAFTDDVAQGAITSKLRYFISRESADLLQLAVRHTSESSNGIVSTVLSILALIVTASGVFGEMEEALNKIWRAPRKGSVLRRLVRGRAVSLALVIGLGFLLMLSMFLTAAITALEPYITRHTPFSAVALAVINSIVSTVLMSLLFAAIFKVLPNKDLDWRDVGIGAVVTALLFQFGQVLLGYYLGRSAVGAAYGAAGGLVVLLLWSYYSAQVFLLGAVFTKVFASHYGSQQASVSPLSDEN